MGITRTQGVVIGETDIGEADKILTVFTKSHGKIKAVVKGAKRSKSSLTACSQFLVYSDYILFRGKDIYKVNSCEVIEPFYNIRNDLQRLTYASYSAEIIGEVVKEELPSYRVLQLFLNTLFALSETDKPLELIIRAFELRLMALIGYKPHIEGCSGCGTSTKCCYFNFGKSGLVCNECGDGSEGSVSVSEATISALRYILKSDIKKLFSFSVPDSVLKELKLINQIYLTDKLEKDFKTLKFLDKIGC